MDIQILTLGGAGFLGIFTHVMMKLDKLNQRTDFDLTLKYFFKHEMPSIMISVSFVIVCMIARGEIVQLKVLGNYLILGFYCIGMSAQSIAYFLKGRTDKKILLLEEKKEEDCEEKVEELKEQVNK